ncbi:DUF4386 domain-containing protein [Chloroflexota bacterium]
MDSYRKTAIIVGVLFIIATAAGVLSLVFSGPLNTPDYLVEVAANETQIIIGGLFMLIMGFAVAGIGIGMYPIFKKQNEVLALGYAGFRLIEGALFIASVVSLLSILTLSQEFVKAGAPDASHFQTMGAVLTGENYWVYHMGTLSLGLAALIFYYLLYKSKQIPRWLSAWGLIGVPLWFAVSLLIIFGLDSSSTVSTLLYLPIGVNEMVLAIWLIVKGFNSSAIPSEPVK